MTEAKVMDIISRFPGYNGQTQMAKIMVQYERPSRFFWAKYVWSSFGRTIMGKAIWENPIKTWMGENSKLGMSLRSSWKRIILICVCGWPTIGWKETKSWSDVESTQQRSRFGRTNIFLGSCIYLGCTHRNCERSKDVVDNYRNMFESGFCGESGKFPFWQTIECNLSIKLCVILPGTLG